MVNKLIQFWNILLPIVDIVEGILKLVNLEHAKNIPVFIKSFGNVEFIIIEYIPIHDAKA